LIVDQLRTEVTGDRAERSARLRWAGGEFRLRIDVPAAYAPPEEDASPYLGVAMMLAMFRHEDLHLDGAVSPRLMRRSGQAQRAWASWAPQIRLCNVTAARELSEQPAGPGTACFLSRGVDSTFTAIRERSDAGPLTHAVFCDTLEPVQGPEVRDEERRLAGEVAALLGLELVVLSTNLRDPGAQLLDYVEMHGVGLAFMALSLAGAMRRVVTPPGVDISTVLPAGSGPMVDQLFSTETVEVVCDDISFSRTEKVQAIAERRPDLLPYLKVCYSEDRSDNCGRCRKCLWTMVSLQAVGVLEQAEGFPNAIDVDAIRRMRHSQLLQRLTWANVAAFLPPRDAELRDAIYGMLRHSSRPPLRERARIAVDYVLGKRESADPAWSESPSAFLRTFTNAAFALARGKDPPRFGPGLAPAAPGAPSAVFGPPAPGLAGAQHRDPGLVGLVRLMDPGARRHRYALGAIPPVAGLVRVGELGALLAGPEDGTVAAWLDDAGRLEVEGRELPQPRRLSVRAGRWVAAPLSWRGAAPLAARARESGLRALTVLRPGEGRSPAGTGRQNGPAGYLRASQRDGDFVLWSAIHPVSGDQLLSLDEREAEELGYGKSIPLGAVAPTAPVTSRLGTGQPHIPWAARFGQRRT
jgi:hypothetical protein